MALNQKSFAQLVQFSRASIGTYVDADGLVKEAPINAPRYEHDPITGAKLGLLIERASTTNQATYSDDFTNAIWPAVGSTRAGGFTAPDGSLTAVKFTDTIGQAAGLPLRPFSAFVTATLQASFCVYVKWASGDVERTFGIYNSTTAAYAASVRLNIVTGAIVTGGTTCKIKAYRNGWFRVNLWADTGLALGNNVSFVYGRAAAVSLDAEWLLWGADIQKSNEISSHVKVVATPVLRARDVVKISGLAGFFDHFNAMVIEGYLPYAVNTAAKAFMLLNNSIINTTADSVVLYADTLSRFLFRTLVGSVIQADVYTVEQIAEQFKVAFRWSTNDFALVQNGVAVTSSNAGAIPANIDQIYLGSLMTTSAQIRFILKDLTFYPIKPTDAKLTLMSVL